MTKEKDRAIDSKYLRIHQIACTSDDALRIFKDLPMFPELYRRREVARIIDQDNVFEEESDKVKLFDLCESEIKRYLNL